MDGLLSFRLEGPTSISLVLCVPVTGLLAYIAYECRKNVFTISSDSKLKSNLAAAIAASQIFLSVFFLFQPQWNWAVALMMVGALSFAASFGLDKDLVGPAAWLQFATLLWWLGINPLNPQGEGFVATWTVQNCNQSYESNLDTLCSDSFGTFLRFFSVVIIWLCFVEFYLLLKLKPAIKAAVEKEPLADQAE